MAKTVIDLSKFNPVDDWGESKSGCQCSHPAPRLSRRAHGQDRKAGAIVKIVLKTLYGIVFFAIWAMKGCITAWMKTL